MQADCLEPAEDLLDSLAELLTCRVATVPGGASSLELSQTGSSRLSNKGFRREINGPCITVE